MQLDDTNLAYLCDPKMSEGARQRGEDPDALPRRYAQLINAAIVDRPADLRICVHLCRGTSRVPESQRLDTNRSQRFSSMRWM